MCKKLIICMGNSYKNGGRCLAGIEVKKSSGGYNIVKNESGSPKWIRPVMKNDHNGIPESMVKAFGMLDVLEVDIANEVPIGLRLHDAEKLHRIPDYIIRMCKVSDDVELHISSYQESLLYVIFLS